LMFEPQRYTKYRKAMCEIGGSIQRVHIPAIVAVVIYQTTLFAQDVMRWPTCSYPFQDQGFCFAVGNCNQIDVTLVFHLHVLMKIFHQQRTRFPCDFCHRGNEITFVGCRSHIGWRSHTEENNPWIKQLWRTSSLLPLRPILGDVH